MLSIIQWISQIHTITQYIRIVVETNAKSQFLGNILQDQITAPKTTSYLAGSNYSPKTTFYLAGSNYNPKTTS